MSDSATFDEINLTENLLCLLIVIRKFRLREIDINRGSSSLL